MLVSDYILSKLADAGVQRAYLVYGGAIAELVDAFPRQDKLRYVVPITEQACGFMAEGDAKVTGKPGCAIVTSGPGVGNIITPIQNAYYDSTPMIVISGQVGTRFIRRNSELRQLGFQETSAVDIVRSITKYAAQPLSAIQLQLYLDIALRVCMEGRRGPVLLDVPSDVMKLYV